LGDQAENEAARPGEPGRAVRLLLEAVPYSFTTFALATASPARART